MNGSGVDQFWFKPDQPVCYYLLHGLNELCCITCLIKVFRLKEFNPMCFKLNTSSRYHCRTWPATTISILAVFSYPLAFLATLYCVCFIICVGFLLMWTGDLKINWLSWQLQSYVSWFLRQSCNMHQGECWRIGWVSSTFGYLGSRKFGSSNHASRQAGWWNKC